MIGNTKLVLIYRDFRNRAYKDLSESKREAFFEYLIDNYEIISNNPKLIEIKFNEIKQLQISVNLQLIKYSDIYEYYFLSHKNKMY